MRLKKLDIADSLDADGEIEINFKRAGAMWINRDGALALIKHLTGLFGLTAAELKQCNETK